MDVETIEVEHLLALINLHTTSKKGDVELDPDVVELIRRFGEEVTRIDEAARERDVQRTELFSLILECICQLKRKVLPEEVIAALRCYVVGDPNNIRKLLDEARRKLETLE
jgi:hypothetical protein